MLANRILRAFSQKEKEEIQQKLMVMNPQSAQEAFRMFDEIAMQQHRNIKKVSKNYRRTVEYAVNKAISDIKIKVKTESPIEDILKIALFERIPTRIFPQYGVGYYRIDLAIPQHRIAIECDGMQYHSTPAQIEHDQKKNKYLAWKGWHVLRFTGHQIHNNLMSCVKEVMDTIEHK